MIEYMPSVVSLKLIKEPKNKVLYKDCAVTPYAGWLPGIELEAIYDNGKKEIISTDNGIEPRTSYGEYLVGTFEGGKTLNTLPAGKYSFIIYPQYNETKSVKIDNVEVKEKKDLPLYVKTGKISVNADWEGSAWIRFKPQESKKYTISTSSKGNIVVLKENSEVMVLSEKSTAKVQLERGKYYYIGSGIQASEFSWAKKVTITIKSTEKINLSKTKITIPSSLTYTGKALIPEVTVNYGNTALKKDKDYTVSCSNNTRLGTASVIIKGKGSYTGEVKKTFKIVLNTPKVKSTASVSYNTVKVTWNKVLGAKTYSIYYRGGSIKNWTLVKSGLTGTSYKHVSDKKTPLISGTAYRYAIKAVNDKRVSSYGIDTKTVKPIPSKPEISGISENSKGIKLQWKQVKGATGYVIQRYDSGKWVTKKSITGTKTCSYTDTTVKKGKTYKYRIAAYRVVNKKKVLSTYSASILASMPANK